MISCHECGEKVAEDTVFCPFCGISMNPVAVGDAQSEDALESTIMMPPSEIAKMVEAESKESTGAAAGKGKEEAAAEEINDIPMPGILQGISKTNDNIKVRSTSGLKASSVDAEMADEAETVEAETVEAETVEKEAVSAEEIEAAQIDSGEAAGDVSWEDEGFGDLIAESGSGEAEKIAAAEVEAPESPERSVEIGAEAISETEQVANAAGEKINADAPMIDAASKMEDSADAEEPVEIGKAAAAGSAAGAEERESAASTEIKEAVKEDSGIAKPQEELEAADEFSGKPIYDSVRIMETSDPYAQDFISTRLGSQEAAFPEKALDEKKEAADSGSVQRSNTTPGIGSTDTDGRTAKKLKPLTEGTILNGRYEIIRKIGGGGMGAVYLASDNNLGGVLRAVKEMVQTHIEEAQQDKAVNDFKRESMILSSLDHVSIPTIFDYFYDEAESRFYLVMKYVSGGDLASRLRAAPEGKLDEVTVTDWAIQIIDVLDYLHNQPSTIVYRDLKPSNIMIDGNSGRIMLIDFGIARSIGQQQEKGVTAVGTMGYAPPELFSGNVEPRSDIYSLGSTMFHLLTGADPQSNPLLIFDFQKNPRPRQINSRISDQMEQILMRSVEYSADARFTSAAEMRAVLAEHLVMLNEGRATFGVAQAPAALGLANQAAFCGFCGQQIIASDLFCAFCGARQPIAQPGVAAVKPAAAAVPTAKLMIEGTSELNMPVYSLQKDQNLVGRRDPMSNIFPEIDLSKYDPQTKISRRHARIWRDGTNYLVEDLGSSNGTVLASAIGEGIKLLPHKPQVLSHGDKLKIGDTTLHFVVG